MRMKKIILTLLAVVAMAGFSGCSSDNKKDEPFIPDYLPIRLIVEVVNEDGQDLLDQNVESNVLNDKMTLTYGDKTTNVEVPDPDDEFKLQPPLYTVRAVVSKYRHNDKNYVIDIGPFPGGKEGTESMTLDLYGQKYEFSFTNIREQNTDIFDRCFYLDGKLIQSGLLQNCVFTIILDR